MEFVYFSFMQGVVAFFAPCAVALLPGYIAAFISRNDCCCCPSAESVYEVDNRRNGIRPHRIGRADGVWKELYAVHQYKPHCISF